MLSPAQGGIQNKVQVSHNLESFHVYIVYTIQVAVKIMNLNNIKEDYVVRNLFREAKIMAKLKHPCIVTLFETMQKADNTYYIVTEVVNGGDLCTYVKSQHSGKLDEKSTKYFARQFVSALSYMHERGIVHRDLKMENVMLNAIQNQIKIVDFGLSNEWTAKCPLKTHCGSPEYAAPELFVTSKVYGPEVDLWSLGIIIYGMIVGQLPFVSKKSSSISSEERRKLFVAQINIGISTLQRKTISCYSYEFRSAINRLLTTDSTKRITITEMTNHPWITENGRVFVRSNPAKKITPFTKNKIINDISTASNLGTAQIIKLIKENCFGTIGGMYNILTHRLSNKFYSSNLVERCLSDTITLDVRCKKDRQMEEVPHLEIRNNSREGEIRYFQTPRSHTVGTAIGEMSKTKTIMTTKPQLHSNHSSASSRSKEVYSSAKNIRPQTVQYGKKQGNKQNSALHKRQEYSELIASTFNSKIKYKKSDKDSQNTQKKRKEFVITSRGMSPNRLFPAEKSLSSEHMKISGSYLLEILSKIPRKQKSLDRSNNPKSSTSSTRSKKSSTSRNSSPLNAFRQFIVPHGDVLENEKQIISTKNSDRISRKSEILRCSALSNDFRKSPNTTKIKSARPVSCGSNSKDSKLISEREK